MQGKRRFVLGKVLIVIAAFALVLMVFSLNSALAKDWPPKNMEIIISHSSGSSQNAATRALGKVWGELMGTNFIYKNKKGASGRIGYDFYLESDALFLSSNQASASIMYKQQNPPWNWKEQIYQMGIFAVDPGAIFVRKDSPFKSLQELIDEAKKRKITFGISYWASPDNLLMHQIMKKTGAQFEIIPYGSSRDLMTNALAGHIEAAYTKVARIARNPEQTRTLAVSIPENTIPHITNNAPTINEVLGEKTLQVASFRAMIVKREWKEKYPQRYKKLKETFEKAKDDPRFLDEAKKLGVDPGLIVDWDYVEIMVFVVGYWVAFEKLGHIYKEKKK